MKSGSKKILIIAIIMIIVLAIAGTAFAYLYIATDVFKSDKELFAKYMEQNKQSINQIINSSIYTTHESIKEKEIYESNTTITASYSEGGEISNPLNNLSLKFKTQKENGYRYRDAQILFEDTPYLRIEGIRNQDVYGIRFSNALREFLSIRDTGNLTEEANKVGLDAETLEILIAIINNDNTLLNEKITKEELKNLINRYVNIIIENFNNATFASQKDAMITYNNNTINTNAYTASLDSTQVQNLIVQILNNLKKDETILSLMEEEKQEEFIGKIDDKLENLGIDEAIPSIKITLYEQKTQTIRTTIEIGLEKITIENMTENGQIKTKIQRSELNNEEQKQQNIEIIKNISDLYESYNFVVNIIEGDSNYTAEFDINMTSNNGIITILGKAKLTQGIIITELNLENVINTTQIENKVELGKSNNVILSDLEETERNRILGIVKAGLPQILTNKFNELLTKLQIQDLIDNKIPNKEPDNQEVPDLNGNVTDEPQLSQVEINRFNSKFEFYTGDSVSAENVKILLDVVKLNLNSVEFIPITNGEDTSSSEEVKESIKLNIEKDKTNVDSVNQILQKIKNEEKYKVSIIYKDSNGLIDYITINEAK